jgi:hypothetical protein
VSGRDDGRRDAARGRDDVAAEAPAGLAAEPAHWSADADGRDDVAVPVDDWCAHRGNSWFTLLDALHPSLGTGLAGEEAAGRADPKWQDCALRDDPAQAVGRLQGDDAAAAVTLADEELHALPRAVAELEQHRATEVGERERVRRGPTEADQAEAGTKPALLVAADQTVVLEGAQQAVGRGAGKARLRLHVGQPRRPDPLERAQHRNGLVDDPDAG